MKAFSLLKKLGFRAAAGRGEGESLPEQPASYVEIMQRPGRRMLNLGCGSRFHPEWINLDFIPAGPGVIVHDLRTPLPFADDACEVVYASHVLEHFSRDEALGFLKECHRVMRPGGVLRIVVPDLEMIARLYLRYLDGAAEGDPEAVIRHEWMTLELLDQLVRERSGGEILRFWQRNPMPVEDFVIERFGEEVRRFLEANRCDGEPRPSGPMPETAGMPTGEQFLKFRATGENHKWMYDKVSLRCLLESTGFSGAKQCRADESAIEGFSGFLLDTNSDGSTRKPDSLFMEATKPR